MADNSRVDINQIKNWRIYLVTDDVLSKGRSHIEVAEQALAGGADVIQLRDKNASSKKLYEQAIKIRELTRSCKKTFIINDRLDIALACQADGLHVGQDDLPASVARKLLPDNMILGVSATTLEEAIQAEKDGADYLGVGPVYEARGTKPDAKAPLGLSLLTQVRQNCHIPIVAIGGINPQNIADVLHHGADCAAVVSCIVAADNIKEATEYLNSTIQNVRNKL